MFRFALYALLACFTAFAGVSWAMRGLATKAIETIATNPVAAGSLQMGMIPTFGGQSAKDYERKMWEATHTARGDDDPKLDRLRMEALQTADAYAMAPCGEYTRLNLIAALAAYTRAWQARVVDCPRLLTVPICRDEKVREITATFSTPLDLRVQFALAKAFSKGGIVIEDFPAEVRRDMLQFAGPSLGYRTVAACGVRHRSAVRDSR
jgi:hypothetical protein